MPFSQTLASAADPRTDALWADALVNRAREPERLRVAFQPVVDLARGVVAGYEALARFDAEPATTPDVLFGAAERLDLAAELEALAVSRARALASRCRPTAFCRSTSARPPSCTPRCKTCSRPPGAWVVSSSS